MTFLKHGFRQRQIVLVPKRLSLSQVAASVILISLSTLVFKRVGFLNLSLIKLDKKLLTPANYLTNATIRLKQLSKTKHQLILENERLRNAYSQIVNQRTLESQPRYDYSRIVKDSKLNLIQADIVLIQGDKLLVESPKLKGNLQKGLAIYDQWLVGRWTYLSNYTAKVDLWLKPNQPARVKITDSKDNLITSGLMMNDNSQVVVKKIIRGINLQGGEIVKLLSGKYVKLPFIGVLGKKLYQDNVYQTWSVNLYWQNQIKIGDNLLLIGL